MENPFTKIFGMLRLIDDKLINLTDDALPILIKRTGEAQNLEPAKYANSRQLAKRYGVHHNTVHNWHKAGYFPKHVIDGVTLYEISEVDTFVKSKSIRAVA